MTDAENEPEPAADVDPDEDVARRTVVVADRDGQQRVWATGWYRVRPETFVHHELFFDPDRINCTYADQSFKSYLLRRDGRDREAARIGRSLLDEPSDELLAHERSFAISVEDVDEIRLRAGSLLFKPKLVIATADRDVEFYHKDRSQDTGSLAEALRAQYDVDVVESSASILP